MNLGMRIMLWHSFYLSRILRAVFKMKMMLRLHFSPKHSYLLRLGVQASDWLNTAVTQSMIKADQWEEWVGTMAGLYLRGKIHISRGGQ